MAVSVLRDYYGIATTTTTSLSLTIPATAQAGDMLVLFAAGAFSSSVPSGWTSLGSPTNISNANGMTLFRTARSGDAGTTVTVTFSGSSRGDGAILVVTGPFPSICHARSLSSSSGSSGTLVSSSFTFSSLSILFVMVARASGTITLNRGTTLDMRAADTVVSSILATENLAADDPTHTVTFSTSPSGTTGYYASQVCLALSGSGGSATHYPRWG